MGSTRWRLTFAGLANAEVVTQRGVSGIVASTPTGVAPEIFQPSFPSWTPAVVKKVIPQKSAQHKATRAVTADQHCHLAVYSTVGVEGLRQHCPRTARRRGGRRGDGARLGRRSQCLTLDRQPATPLVACRGCPALACRGPTEGSTRPQLATAGGYSNPRFRTCFDPKTTERDSKSPISRLQQLTTFAKREYCCEACLSRGGRCLQDLICRAGRR
jgi:hypothetical protein